VGLEPMTSLTLHRTLTRGKCTVLARALEFIVRGSSSIFEDPYSPCHHNLYEKKSILISKAPQQFSKPNSPIATHA
jgi:hypothetical protein